MGFTTAFFWFYQFVWLEQHPEAKQNLTKIANTLS